MPRFFMVAPLEHLMARNATVSRIAQRGFNEFGVVAKLLVSSIKAEVKKKRVSNGWTFSC
jgi:hypothetical protein